MGAEDDHGIIELKDAPGWKSLCYLLLLIVFDFVHVLER